MKFLSALIVDGVISSTAASSSRKSSLDREERGESVRVEFKTTNSTKSEIGAVDGSRVAADTTSVTLRDALEGSDVSTDHGDGLEGSDDSTDHGDGLEGSDVSTNESSMLPSLLDRSTSSEAPVA
jgi:hypothetical protein